MSLSSSVSQQLDGDISEGSLGSFISNAIHVAEPFTNRSPFICAACTGLAELSRVRSIVITSAGRVLQWISRVLQVLKQIKLGP